MSKRARIRVFKDKALEIAAGDGKEPAGELYQAARRALHVAMAKAGGALDQPGHGDVCLSAPEDMALAVGHAAYTLFGEGYIVEIGPAGAPFEIPE
jgi:hypothetical protein